MSNYDFKPLNDKEFEILCADLLGEVEGKRFERFKAGKDSGVDGRFFTSDADEVILQCKHWSNTPIKQLIHSISTTEKSKLDKLKPHRYMLAVSNPLSRADKKAIHRALSPYIVSESDIYGKEDLNDLLIANPHVEQRHYKLWLHSISVLKHIFNNAILGRSAFSLEEIVSSSARYVVTANHEAALKILETLGVVIITGEPGIGKTTLADHLCLYYVARDYAYLRISDEIREAETIFDSETKQVFYFDDFLGRNYLDALKGHEGSQITQFIRRIARNRNKRFVLTSRTTILNQGKLLSDSFDQNNVQRNEYELRINSLSELDKAQILYNHIWHSSLEKEYVEQLYFQRRYRKIIAHRNFNPRLISYITDATRLEGCPPSDYWQYIEHSLTNPSQIWENPFIAQLDDFARSIVLLIVLNGGALRENVLAEGYYRYIALPENQNFQGKGEFQANIRLLTGSFINRSIASNRQPMIDLFNPSIGDYVLSRYRNDIVVIRLVMLSLRTEQSLVTLRSLKHNDHISESQAFSICDVLINSLADTKFDGAIVAYVSSLCKFIKDWSSHANAYSAALHAAVFFVLKEGMGTATDESLEVVELAVEKHIISPEHALSFVESNIEVVYSSDEIRAMSSLLLAIPKTSLGHSDRVMSLSKHVVELLTDKLTDFVDVDSDFSQVEYGDHQSAEQLLAGHIEATLDDLGVSICAADLSGILESYDVAYELDKFFENSIDPDDRGLAGPSVLAVDAIDDLFERS